MMAFGERKVRAKNQLDPSSRLTTIHGCPRRTDVRPITIASTDTFGRPKRTKLTSKVQTLSKSSKNIHQIFISCVFIIIIVFIDIKISRHYTVLHYIKLINLVNDVKWMIGRRGSSSLCKASHPLHG